VYIPVYTTIHYVRVPRLAERSGGVFGVPLPLVDVDNTLVDRADRG
jgi:hypothetical protein